MSETIYTVEEVAGIISGKLTANAPSENRITDLLTDSRSITQASGSLFFAIKGERHDGHKFINELFKQGVHNFVVTENLPEIQSLPANFIVVDNALSALQKLTAKHRNHFSIPVIGITGSNGKTIVKEWIYQLLRGDKNIVRSPKSYNSQIGVPLSVWRMNEDHQLAVFEAGISLPGEMKNLEEIIHPDIGIFTNIGSAHDENFEGEEQKIREKLQLFTHSQTLIYCKDYPVLEKEISQFKFSHPDIKLFAWSRKSRADLQVGRITRNGDETEIQAVYESNFINIRIPFTDDASIENSILCWSLMLIMGYSTLR